MNAGDQTATNCSALGLERASPLRRWWRRWLGLSLLSLGVGGGLVGCGPRTMLAESAVDLFPGPEQELDYWQHLQTQRVLTNHDAMHGLLLLAQGEDTAESYEQRAEAARRLGWIRGTALPPANESAAVGLVAVAVCDVLDARGGLTMRLASKSPRYCTRELVFMGLIPARTENQSLSGLEFLDLVGRVERRMTAASSDRP